MKKIIALVLALVLTVAASVAGTVAYLQAEDSDVNVMTLGNVKIEQIEQERAEDGTLQDFTQAKPAYPAVGPIEWASKGVDVNGTEYKVFTDDLKNVVDKIVTVKNTGKSDAYIRTIIALEAPDYDPNDLIHVNVSPDGLTYTSWTPVDINGVEYVYSVFTYEKALEAGEVSTPSLVQVFLDSKATNEDVAKFGDTWEILALSQAVQTEGFTDAATALDTAFGKASEKAAEWFGKLETPEVLSDADAVYDSSLKNGTYVLGADFKTSDTEKSYSANRQYAIRDDKDYTIDLNGHTIYHDTVYNGMTYLYTVAYNSKLTIEGNGTIISTNGASSAAEENAIFYAQSTGEVVINGGNYKPENGIAVWAGNGAHIVINDGNFVSSGTKDCELIYSSGGVIDIYGGFFHNEAWEGRPVNVADANRATGFINIYGGTFVNFDPSTGGNDPNNIKVMDGYKVVSETQSNGDIWYTVVPE